MYGSSRLGLWRPDRNVEETDWSVFDIATMAGTGGRLSEIWRRGVQQYELSNHLGNVLATVSDRKIQVGNSGAVAYDTADVKSASDYYPFGMQMVGRTYEAGAYR